MRKLGYRRLAGMLPMACALVLAAALAGPAAAAASASERLPAQPMTWQEVRALAGGQQINDRELARQHAYQARAHWVHQLLGHRLVSVKSNRWLAKRGLGMTRPAAARVARERTDSLTLRILLVRISFEANRDPTLVTMAPDGDFFLDPHDSNDPLPIDPTPHDKAYFESHLAGLAEYYRFQSGGRLTIESRVLPDGARDSYKVSDVADYGPGAGAFWTLAGLERLVRDMITVADEGTQADGSVNLAEYGDEHELTYIIFAHAGSDWQSDINQDSPNDIPTFFVTLGEPQPLVGGQLSECSVIPETTNQDGYRGSIAAALYHEFGHALGLPDIYDATTGLTQCGVWDLMDSGTNLAATLGYRDPVSGQIMAAVVSGILPPSLSAWCKWYLGWLDGELVTGGPGRSLRLPAVGVPREHYALHAELPGYAFDVTDPQVLIGGASFQEFFLVENRWVPRSVDDTPYDPLSPDGDWGGLYLKRDPATGVVLYLAGDRASQPGLNTGYYDYFLPEGGLLVWQANMDRIEADLADNTINRFGDGLRLVEADGIQDIGVLEPYVSGWYGSDRDPFAPWNAAGHGELYVQGAGLPTSRAFDRAWTGFRVWDIADPGDAHGAVMTLRAAVEPLQAGWPLVLPAGGTPAEPSARSLDPTSVTPLLAADGRRLLAAVTATAADLPLLFIWTAEGEAAYLAPADLPDGAVAELSASPVMPPVALPRAAAADLLIIGGNDGRVLAMTPSAALAEVAWAIDIGDSLLAGPQPVPLGNGDWLLFLLDGGGFGHLRDLAGQAVGEPLAVLTDEATILLAAPRTVQLDDGPALVLVTDDGWRVQPVDAAGFGTGAFRFDQPLAAPAQVAVLSAAAGHRLLIFGPDGLQGCWRSTAGGDWSVGSWPDPGAALAGEPAVADLDGDGSLDVIAVTTERIYAWQANGVSLTGFPVDLANLFPLAPTVRLAGPLVVADLAGGPGNELAFTTDQGHLFVLTSDGRVHGGTPFRFGAAGGVALAMTPLAGERATLALASAGGVAGPPLERRLTQGRLALYGERPLLASGPATAAWFGPGGGPTRTGPVGQARPVAGETAAARGQDGLVLYPNPLAGSELNVRFWSATNRAAEFVLYNLQGEIVRTARLGAVQAGLMNEQQVRLGNLAAGLYVVRLTCERTAGRVDSQVKTLAVVR
ncbi:MAG: T9SS type A sorting domain-containing protein [Candidatus Krumholzibacteria bacterium]|nr:T9SS type A sorting domain-containing protein [Candidatus Krumholzibacteria bacterium]